jgi:hypothetical protein
MNNWHFTQKELEAMRALGADIRERTIRGNVTLVAGEMPVFYEQFSDVFKHPLQSIGPALWLVGRWSRMGYCK